MMDVFRGAAKSWVAKVLIGLLAMSFVVWGIADVFTGFRASALATVGGREISAQDFSQSFNQAIQNLGRQTGQNLTAEDARKFGIDRQVLDNLIQSAAIDAQGSRLKLAISDAAIAQEIAANPTFHDSGGKFNAEQFRQLLEQNGMNEQMYLASERQAKLRSVLTDAIDGDFVAPKALAEAMHRHRNEQRDARYFVVNATENEVPPATEDEIKKQYEDNPQTYTSPEYRSIAIMKAEPADIAAKVTIPEDELRAGYDRLRNDYFTPEKRIVLQMTFPTVDEARNAKDRIAAGEDFLAIAKERGVTEADATMADRTKADFLDAKVADAAFSLAEGAVSDPVQGSLAITLLKVTKIVPEQQQSFESVKADLTQRLQIEKAREEVQSVYDAVEDARAGQTKFEDIASSAGIPFQLIALTDAGGRGKDGKDLDIPHKDDVLKAAFNSDAGVENDALTPAEGFVWYEVREVVPSAVEPLEAVKERVKADLMARKLSDLAAEKAKKLVERAEAGVAFETLAQEAGATLRTATGLKRNETGADFDSEAVSAVFSVPQGGFTFALGGDGSSAKVIQSQAVLLPPYDANSEDAKAMAQSVNSGAAKDVLSLYLAALQEKLGVSINETLWRQTSGLQVQ